jgi:hypothetical protein
LIRSPHKSELLKNISKFGLDSRIGKALLSVKGTNIQVGERISSKSGYSPVILDYRYYEKGDAIKDIDWKISARTERLFVKLREGYRQTDFLIAIDGSGSMRTSYNGSTSKFVAGLTLAYIIGRVALKNRDRIYISHEKEKLRADTENSLLDILTGIESDKKHDDFWKNEIEPSANVFIISDFFIETDKLQVYLKNQLHKTQKLFLLSIHDNAEQSLDFSGRYKFLDPESKNSLLAECGSIAEVYRHLYNSHYHEVSRIGKLFGAKPAKILTSEDPFHAFMSAVS